MGEDFRVREEGRTGEASREEAAEFVVDADVEGVGNLGESLGPCVVICDVTIVLSPAFSAADRCAGSDATSASWAPLDRPEVPLR